MSVTDTPIIRQSSQPRSGDGLIAALADVWHDLLKTLFDTYHPERHYMRGPGPACAAKRARRG